MIIFSDCFTVTIFGYNFDVLKLQKREVHVKLFSTRVDGSKSHQEEEESIKMKIQSTL